MIDPQELPEDDDANDPDRLRFDAERRSAITSTDVAAILGLSRYGSKLTVYRAKTGESVRGQPSLPAWLGIKMESVVAELYTGATGIRLRSDNLFHRHPQHTWLATHLDRRAIGDSALIVELKTRSSTRGFGEDGSSEVPPDVWCQCQTQLAVTGAREVHVAVLFGSRSYATYKLLPDTDFIESLIPELERFWFDHVIARVEPPASGIDADSDIVSALAGGESGVLVSATPEQEALIAEYRLARTNEAQASVVLREKANRIKQLIGEDADGIRGSFGTIYWRRTKDIHKTDWRTVAQVYRDAARALLELAAPSEDRETAEYAQISTVVDLAQDLYTIQQPGIRRLWADLREDY